MSEHSTKSTVHKPPFASILPRIRRKLFFLALTAGLGGLQCVFSVQMALGSPYLLSLGFSKPLMALVWIAGPLAGVIGQPFFGLSSDNCRIAWGRRRPFIATGFIIISLSLLALAWVDELVHYLAWVVGITTQSHRLKTATLTAAALFIWIMNFAIQPLQCGLRALIIDLCPSDDMDAANAWASRMISIASLLGYGADVVDLPVLLYFSTSSRFKALCVLAVCVLVVTTCSCLLFVREADPYENGPRDAKLDGVFGKLKYIRASIFNLSPDVIGVCKVQFFSWMGWFMFLYYVTTYVNELYIRNKAASPTFYSFPTQNSSLHSHATSYGSLALVFFAFTQVLTSIIAPLLVPHPLQDRPSPTSLLTRFHQKHTRNPWTALRTLWFLSHLLFALAMLSTLFITTVTGAIVLAAMAGISAALAQFVPFTLVSVILSRHRAIRVSALKAQGNLLEPYVTEPGIVMGLHNMAIAAPQLVAACVSSVIFWVSKGRRGGTVGTAWALAFGGLSALVALWFTGMLREDDRVIMGERRPRFVLGQRGRWMEELGCMRDCETAEAETRLLESDGAKDTPRTFSYPSEV